MSATTELHDNTKTLNQVAEPKEKIELLNELSEPTHEELEVRRRRRLAKWSQVITLIFVVLELAIAFRVLLELIAANPASPFAHFVYQMTGPFLVPFAGLTAMPSADGAVLEIPTLIAMVVYGVLYWLIIRVTWVIFDPAKARDAAKYKPDL
jgi:YggT family protein